MAPVQEFAGELDGLPGYFGFHGEQNRVVAKGLRELNRTAVLVPGRK
jgi:hypothetical protein